MVFEREGLVLWSHQALVYPDMWSHVEPHVEPSSPRLAGLHNNANALFRADPRPAEQPPILTIMHMAMS